MEKPSHESTVSTCDTDIQMPEMACERAEATLGLVESVVVETPEQPMSLDATPEEGMSVMHEEMKQTEKLAEETCVPGESTGPKLDDTTGEFIQSTEEKSISQQEQPHSLGVGYETSASPNVQECGDVVVDQEKIIKVNEPFGQECSDVKAESDTRVDTEPSKEESSKDSGSEKVAVASMSQDLDKNIVEGDTCHETGESTAAVEPIVTSENIEPVEAMEEYIEILDSPEERERLGVVPNMNPAVVVEAIEIVPPENAGPSGEENEGTISVRVDLGYRQPSADEPNDGRLEGQGVPMLPYGQNERTGAVRRSVTGRRHSFSVRLPNGNHANENGVDDRQAALRNHYLRASLRRHSGRRTRHQEPSDQNHQ